MTIFSEDELVSRAAPRWAWEIIDQTLACDAQSSAFDAATRADVDAALKWMVLPPCNLYTHCVYRSGRQ